MNQETEALLHTFVWYWDDSDGCAPQRVTCKIHECFPDEPEEAIAHAKQIQKDGYAMVGGGAVPLVRLHKA